MMHWLKNEKLMLKGAILNIKCKKNQSHVIFLVSMKFS